MITFIGDPGMLVRLVPPIGNIKHVRFDTKGEFTTENQRLINRFHHKFDSVPSNNAPTEEMTEDLELQDYGQPNSFPCKKCGYSTDNKGALMAHYRGVHPKE